MEEKTLTWRESYRPPASLTAEEAMEELERIRGLHGVLKPQFVVDEARAEGNPLHDVFDWDDSVAANKHRLHQARTMIRSIAVVVVRGNSEAETVPQFFNVKTEESGSSYVTREMVVEQRDVFDYVLSACKERSAEVARSMADLLRMAEERDDLKKRRAKVASAASTAERANRMISNL